jgi:hypothetical protein
MKSGLIKQNETVILDANGNLSSATTSRIGGIKLGYTGTGKNYPVKLDSNSKAYVEINGTIGATGPTGPTGVTGK